MKNMYSPTSNKEELAGEFRSNDWSNMLEEVGGPIIILIGGG